MWETVLSSLRLNRVFFFSLSLSHFSSHFFNYSLSLNLLFTLSLVFTSSILLAFSLHPYFLSFSLFSFAHMFRIFLFSPPFLILLFISISFFFSFIHIYISFPSPSFLLTRISSPFIPLSHIFSLSRSCIHIYSHLSPAFIFVSTHLLSFSYFSYSYLPSASHSS